MRRFLALLALSFTATACGSDGDENGASGGAGGTAGSSGSGGTAGSSGSGGSSGTSGAGGTAGGCSAGHSIWVEPTNLADLAGDTFFDHPWPSHRRMENGHVRWDGYPNPSGLPLVTDFVDSMNGVLDGFSPAAAGYLRFDVALDLGSLPADPAASIAASSAIQLVDVDPASPERGQRHLISTFFRKPDGAYWQSNTLAYMPTFGFPLRPATRYAVVVTDAVRAEGGGCIAPSADLAAQLATPDAVTGEALGELATAGIESSHIVHLSVFTTNDPTKEIRTIRDWVMDNYPAPTADATKWAFLKDLPNAKVYTGEYGKSPDFQRGSIPFQTYGSGGELAFDANGVPEVQREFSLRFSLAIPLAAACPMPAGGYPIALYAHGTGGDYLSAMRAGHEGDTLTKQCIAVMGIDQIFHGTRPGGECGQAAPPCNSNVELIFFNFINPTAARANGPESAIDVVQQARLFTETHLVLPASVAGTDVSFDASKLIFFGHSQGGLNGPMFLAIDDQARGGVLSGSGSILSITLLEKTKPVDITVLVRGALGLGGSLAEEEELNSLHPGISMAQTIVDTTDPIHYVHFIARSPRAGFRPKSVLMTEGVNPDFTGDNYTPPHAIEVQAVALGLPPQTPVIHTIGELAFSDLTPVTIPSAGLSGNLGGGQASGILAQWPAAQASDGHFVLYDIPAAMTQATQFARNLVDDQVGRVPAP